MVLQSPPPLAPLDKGLRASSLDDPVLSPRTPPPSRGVPWSPTPAQQETPLASWADVAKVNSMRSDEGKFRTPTGCQAQLTGTPQPCVAWSYIASPSMEMDDDPRSPGAQTPRRDPTSPLQPARALLECPTPAKTGAAFDWAAHFQLAPQGIFPFDMGAAAFPWQAQAAPAAPRCSSPSAARCSSPSAASPRTPGASPFRLRSQLTSPPPVGLSGPQRRRSPSPGAAVGSPLRELMEADDPNLGRFRRDFCDISPIARGQFSTVYKAQHKTDRHLYALKVQTASAPGDRRAPAREVFALAAVATAGAHCEHLVRYFGSWQEDDRMHIQIELCESTLRHHLQRRVIERPLDPHFGEEDLMTVLRQTANGLATLHGIGFVHLDVKPDNILFGRDGCYKLGDLGLAISTATGGGPVTEGDCRYLPAGAMPAPRPAESCCGFCPLLQGVQIIASYTVVVGMFSLLSLFMQGPRRTGQPESLAIVHNCQTAVHVLALFAGLKGLVGIMFRDPGRLRSLLRYQVAELIMTCIAFICKEVEECEELKRLQRHRPGVPPVSCSSARVLLMVEFTINAMLLIYFAYIIWSLITRLEAGELGVRPPFFDGEHELADRSGLADPWLLVGGGASGGELSMQRAPLAGLAGGQSAGAPRPFSGAPRRLQEQSAGMPAASEPFTGTPHRLE